MRPVLVAIVALAAVSFCAGVLGHVHLTFPRAAIFVGGMVGLFALSVASAFIGFSHWRRASGLWMLPGFISLASLLCLPRLTAIVGASIKDRQFKDQVEKYEQVVSAVRDGVIPAGQGLTNIDVSRIPVSIRDLIKIKASRCDNGKVTIMFFLSGLRFQNGYLYTDQVEKDVCLSAEDKPERNYQLRHVSGHWFHFTS
jgi:hypothetical protein